MPASIIDGKHLASICKNELKEKIIAHQQHGFRAPSLAVVLIGSDEASVIYVTNKRKACAEVGIQSYFYELPEATTQAQLVDLIHQLNAAEHVDGILIQLPLPPAFDEAYIIEQIKPEKDVDGFHPYNLGRLAQKNPSLRPCTPFGIMQLINHYKLQVKGKHAVVIGASNIVGRPMSFELLLAGATVTVCHRLTPDLEPFVRAADILVVATGVIDVISTQWLSQNQIIFDVGIHRLPNGTIRGDIDFSEAQTKVAWITPVPGGVGPMTIATLLQNTFKAASGIIG